MKLYLTSRSPFARKVMIIAKEKDIKLDTVIVNLQDKPAELLAVNPIGAIPTLVTDDNTAYYDSPVICEYLDNIALPVKFFPTDFGKRIKAEKLQALADGMVECALKVFFERMKPAESQDSKTIEKFLSSVDRCLESLERTAPKLSATDITIAEIAIASALGYIGFRMPDIEWQKKAPALAAWFNEISKRPSLKETEPKMD